MTSRWSPILPIPAGIRTPFPAGGWRRGCGHRTASGGGGRYLATAPRTPPYERPWTIAKADTRSWTSVWRRYGGVGAEVSSEPKRQANAQAVCASRYAGQQRTGSLLSCESLPYEQRAKMPSGCAGGLCESLCRATFAVARRVSPPPEACGKPTPPTEPARTLSHAANKAGPYPAPRPRLHPIQNNARQGVNLPAVRFVSRRSSRRL